MASLGRLTVWLMTAGCLAAAPPTHKSEPWRAALAPRFERNLGQWDPEVRFMARLSSYRAEVRPGEVRILPSGAARAVGLQFEGGSPWARIEGEGRLASTSNYLLGHRPEKWATGVPHYRAVRYREIYPGVDALFYVAGELLEYDLQIAPGADPGRIRIRFHGADSLRLTREGDLEVTAGGGRLLHKRPAAYQWDGGRLQTVHCRYRLLSRDRAAVEVGSYRPDRPLVIDPVLAYATYLGTGSNDAIVSVKVDRQGMIYVAGYLGAGDLAATADGVQTAAAGARDIFVAKLDPSRESFDSLLYFTYLGGSRADSPTAMAVDEDGNVYLTGWTQSTDFPLGGNAPQVQRAGDTGQDAFVVKLSPSIPGPLGLVFSTYLGGELSETGYAIDVDEQGYVYVAGVTRSEEFPLAGRPIQRGRWGDQDAFIAWLDPNAPDPASALLYSSYLGGEYNDEARAVAALGRGVAAIASATFSQMYHVSPNAFTPAYRGGGDVFLTVLDMNKPEYDGLVYSTYFGGLGNEEARRMVRDAQGRLIVTGYTLSMDFPVTESAFQATARRAGQVFVAVLDPRRDGLQGLIYSTYFGGSGGEVAYDVALDAAGRVYLTGYTLSSDFPVTEEAFQKVYRSGVEAFCTVLDLAAPPERALVYSTYLGGLGINVGRGIAVSPGGTVYIAGEVQDRTLPVTTGALQAAHAGGLADGFIIGLKLWGSQSNPDAPGASRQSP